MTIMLCQHDALEGAGQLQRGRQCGPEEEAEYGGLATATSPHQSTAGPSWHMK